MAKGWNKVLSCMLVLSVLLSCIPAMPVVAAAALESKNGLLDVEAEKLVFTKDKFSIVTHKSLSGGKGLSVNVEDKNIPPADAAADIDLSFKADKAGTYKIWARSAANQENGRGNSLFISAGGGEYAYAKLAGNPETPQWGAIGTVTVAQAGDIASVRIKPRQNIDIMIDRFIIAADVNYIPNDVALGLAKATPTPVPTPTPKIEITTKDGSAVFEAEALPYNKDNWEVVSSQDASGGKGLGVTNEDKTVPAKSVQPDINLSFNADKTGTYSVWARTLATQESSAGNSMFVSVNDGDYLYLPLSGTPTEFAWTKVASLAVTAGQVGSVRVIRRQRIGIVIDKLIITSNKMFTPSGKDPDPASVSSVLLPSDTFPKPSVTPPAEHPRMMFTQKDLPAMKANFKTEQNKPAYDTWQKFLNVSFDGKLAPPVKQGGTNYSATILTYIECYAFDYAVNGNEENGKKAVEGIKNYADSIAFDADPLSYRYKGHVIFTVAEVYDWCYPLIGAEDRKILIALAESIAGGLDMGYPPSKQNAVCGHGGENNLLRDLLAFGIATYNERPDIYNYVAGRILSQHVLARNYMYESDSHMQGNAYGQYRGGWEIWSAWLFKRMSGQDVYSERQQYFPYLWMYSRRPDGQAFRIGDDYWEASGRGTYWNGWYSTLFLVSNYYGDPYLKREFARETPTMSTFNTQFSTMSPVTVLAFNDPELEGKSAEQLPLSKYFASPRGMMVARTSWDDGKNAPAVIALMNIGERWGANHAHLDAGSFQLYYKGILASESGCYDDGYDSESNMNYNKRSISSNTLTIYDPDEKTAMYKKPVANDGGQKAPADGGEPYSLKEWMDDSYVTGKVLGHEFGPDPMAPEYTYIKGDITKAYSDKVSEVLRSMVFMPLEDADHPGVMIVMDKINAKNAGFEKSFLVHVQEEPTVEGNKTVVTRTQKGYNGKMVVETLLPKNPKIEKIGGEGKESWINGKNYPPAKTQVLTGDTEAIGWGRVEISPSAPSNVDYFLNVMTVSDADTKAADLQSTLIEGDGYVGAVISNRVAIFGKEAARMEKQLKFTIPGQGSYKVFVSGIKEGTWATADGQKVVVSADGGAAFFNAAAGEVALTYQSADASKPAVAPAVIGTDTVGIRINKEFKYSDVAPVVVEGRTLVPMRVIFESLGASVAWDDATHTATATKDGVEIKITEDSKTATVAGEVKELDVPATILNGRFVVPVRFVAEAMGAKVTWDPFANLVDIVPGVMPGTANSTPSGPSANKDNLAQIVESKCSGYFEQTTPDLSYDGDPETLWSVEGDGQWIQYGFREPTTIVSVYILLNKATERQAYFDLQVSDDGTSFKTVLSCTANGISDGELFILKEPVKTKYFRYLCKGNSVSKWNAIKEIEFRTK